MTRREAIEEPPMRYFNDWDWPSLAGRGVPTATVADKCTRKVVGEPYRGKPDVRFDERAEGNADTWTPTEAFNGHSEVVTRTLTT